VLVAEAGTGTGKTFAYLVPALMAGGKVIISTGTKTLQDQLFQRDLPTVRDALKAPATIALLKGRANYVCHYHLERARKEGRFLSREEAGHILAIARFAKTSSTGDKAECAAVPEDSAAWLAATSTRDNCLGQECPNAKECFVMAARREAQAADVVVVNHHLFFADVMLRDSGVAELLPACNTVIFDEAHQLPETASLFFGENVSTAQLLDLARDARMEGLAAAKDFAELPRVRGRWRRRRATCAWRFPARTRAFRWRSWKPAFHEALEKAAGELGHFGKLLESQAERSEGLEHCWRRAQELQLVLKRWRDVDEPGLVRWVEVFSQALSMNATPLFIADIFKKQMEGHPRAWIFTSATLAVESDFSHYCTELGLTGRRHRLLGQPLRLPEPGAALCAAGHARPEQPRLQRGGGRGGLAADPCQPRPRLRAVHLAARHAPHPRTAQGALRAEGFDHPLLLQGEGSRASCWRASAAWATPCWWPARASGRAWMCAARRCARHHRQAALRAARRPGAGGAHRAHEEARAATPSWNTSCRAPSSASSRAPGG
jgi:ATP-dependent DNA helicase DinG